MTVSQPIIALLLSVVVATVATAGVAYRGELDLTKLNAQRFTAAGGASRKHFATVAVPSSYSDDVDVFPVLRLSDAPSPTDVASVAYTQAMSTTGWNELTVTTQASFSDKDQAYAAGYVEGFATAVDVVNAMTNQPAVSSTVLEQFMMSNNDWMTEQIRANKYDPYWIQVDLSMRQLTGMLHGINTALTQAGRPNVTRYQVFFQAIAGDFIDLQPALNITLSKDWRKMSPAEFAVYLGERTHCSALVKLALDLSDLYFGHATWSTYNTMSIRIFKHYRFNFVSAPTKEMSFSSYPGSPASIDDYYVTSTGLAVIETTLNVFNQSIYVGNVGPNSVLYFIRIMVANRLATDGATWSSEFGKYNSGTYNNEWMVVDLKLFTPGQDVVPGTLWILEQMPGMIVAKDMTSVLQYGYWPSYNVPYFPEVFNYSGSPEAVATQGWQMADYQRCVRAQIFRRDQANVQDMPAMQLIMQYNQYQTDPISEGNPIYAIASRGDLMVPAMCFGAIDAKVSSWYMYSTGRQILAFSGPTPQQGIFDFNNVTNPTPLCSNVGGPSTFDFLWTHFQPPQ